MALKSPIRQIPSLRKMLEDGILGGISPIFKFDQSLITFTPNMAKRSSPGPFETAPIVQGEWAASFVVGDIVSFARGSLLSTGFYANLDLHQGTISFWITPEWDGNDGKNHGIIDSPGGIFQLYKHSGNTLYFRANGATFAISVAGWTAGTTYHVVVRWDRKNSLDGTNHACISINGSHNFGVTSYGAAASNSPIFFGGFRAGTDIIRQANAIIEGLTIYRRPLFDGTYGVAANWDDSGPIDEINEIYNAGVGKDPCLITGSWDAVLCLPTNSTAEALTTGTGEAWSHPHSSGVLEHQWHEDGGYLGRPWAVIANGAYPSGTSINCGSGATIDDMPSGQFTIDFWARIDSNGINGARWVSKGYGFELRTINNQMDITIFCATTNAKTVGGWGDWDGKWHHYTLMYDDTGDRKIYFARDGVWKLAYGTQTAGVGAYTSDAANDLYLLNLSNGAYTADGALGWIRFSSSLRYTVGTDFVPVRQPPATDGNTIEQYNCDDSSGATLTAEVTSPGNDGTISNGTWEEQWDQEGTPIVPYSVEFDGSTTEIDCGSGATLDDIPSGAQCTFECWIRWATDAPTYRTFLSKTSNWEVNGWHIATSGSTGPTNKLYVRFMTDNVSGVQETGQLPLRDGKWHHVAVTYDDSSGRIPSIWFDGINVSAGGTASTGNYVSDAAGNLMIGELDGGSRHDGFICWTRLSNNIRYSDTFTPPSRLNPPTTDGNTVEQWNFRDGAGTTLTAEVTSPGNDGTITPGSGGWLITPDMQVDSPADRIFNWGYVIGNDAVDEGITEILTGLSAGQNYVVRAVASVESASRGRPKIIIYDETNGAQITALEGPSFTGQHDGGADSATLTDTTARFPQMLVGWTIYNITDGSSATITAISGDMQTITGALSGGAEDDWDISDEYRIVPPGGPEYYDDYPWIETFCFELPTNARNGVASDCTSISVKLVNGVNEGVIKWHQVELLVNLVDNPSLETGAGNPWIPDGWVNIDLDAGDTEQELAIIHSGSSSMEWNTGAIQGEFAYDAWINLTRSYYSAGCWFYGDGSLSHRMGFVSSAHGDYQYALVEQKLNFGDAAKWLWGGGVIRRDHANPQLLLEPLSGASADRFTDDVYLLSLDDVSLTVTPASEANSAESGGIRVDGYDICSQPIPAGILGPTAGHIKWKVRPRHAQGALESFGVTNPIMAAFYFDINNQIYLQSSNDDNLRLYVVVGGISTNNAIAASNLVADQEYLFEIKYNATDAILKIDGVTTITVTPGAGINFGANIPNSAYWGKGLPAATINQHDDVFINP